MIEANDSELDNTNVNSAPLPTPSVKEAVTPVTVPPTEPVILKELVVNVWTPPTKPVLPSILEEVAGLNDPEATLVTIKEVPPFWK